MAHSFFKILLPSALLMAVTVQSANCQASYNYRSGNARVVMGAGGLPNPSSSYITGGTLSRSAQAGAGLGSYGYLPSGASTAAGQVAGAGITPGVSGNSNLPAARMGSTVGMAGDYMRSDLNPNFSYQQPKQNVRYRTQSRQQQHYSNRPATYAAQGYTGLSSNPTGRQATLMPTPASNQSQSAAAPNNSGATNSAAASTGKSGTTSSYRDY